MAQKRDRFISQLQLLASKKGLKFRETRRRGKGGHTMVWVGDDKVTTLPARDIDPRPRRKF